MTSKRSKKNPPSLPRGLTITRRFTRPNRNPLDEVVWERRQSVITNPDGSVVFKMEGAEIPSGWSQLATDIVVSKYFRKAGLHGKKELGETSVRQVVHRLARTIREAGERLGYFASAKDADAFEAELSYMLVHQYGAFNSPVWFNCGLWHRYGIEGSGGNWAWDERSPSDAAEMFETKGAYERPQCSACFIQSVGDDLMSIYELVKSEARLFKYGSGTGTNFSALRGKQEKLSGGGTSSGLMSFLEVFDRAAGATKSGGTTRRAAKMVCLDMDHPEIVDFVEWKAREERKAQALISCGFPADFNGEAYRTVSGQNSNNSVRVSDEFMKAVMSGGKWDTRARTTGEIVETLDARSLWRKAAEAAWACADPGVQYHSTINRWHTCPNTGSINASNPCQPAWATVLTPEGIRTIGEVQEGDTIWSGQRWTRITKKWSTGVKPVFEYRTRAGSFFGTANHRVVAHGEKIEAQDAEEIDTAQGPTDIGADVLVTGLPPQAVVDGLVFGDGGVRYANQRKQAYTILYIGKNDQSYFTSEVGPFLSPTPFDQTAHRVETTLCPEELPRLPFRRVPTRYRNGGRETVRAFLRGLYSANGSIVAGRVTLKATSFAVIQDVQQMLSSLGIRSYHTVNRATSTTFANGSYTCRESMDLNITTDRRRFQELIGFIQPEKRERLNVACEHPTLEARAKKTYDIIDVLPLGEEEVFDMTVEDQEHTYWTGGLLVSNCSEYMFLDDSACNLASLNLTKFLGEDGTFDVEAYRHAVRVFFLAQEILVDFSSYPTRQIAKNSHDYRPLGLGYANLGTLLMLLGLPYDSEEGRSLAGALTSILCGHAYRVSAEIAAAKGPFPGYEQNREPMLRVMGMHRDATRARADEWRDANTDRWRHEWDAACEDWDEVMRLGQEHGFRNAQSTVLAPTGTIGLLMDCDTTGVEPDFALVKFKKLAGGGYFKIVNQSVPEALDRLGYTEVETQEIVAYLTEHMTIEGAPHLLQGHYDVFDCANRCGKNGKRFIRPMAHIQMMAAVQPFLSGAISKTVNLPNETTVEEVQRIYEEGWRLGLKAVALYRDGCKASQPLSATENKENKEVPVEASPQHPDVRPTGLRVRLPKKRGGFTQEARVGGHKIFLRTGEYLDGSLGEIFVDMHKEGAAFRSLMNCFSMAVSVGLQYGVPLETFVDQFTFTRFEPQGVVEGHENVKLATSIIDYMFRVLAIEYLHRYDLGHVLPVEEPVETRVETAEHTPLRSALDAQLEEMMGDAPVCDMCGHITVRNGACYKCLNCGNSMGCS